MHIGIDAVEINRFEHWHKYPTNILARIFTEQEINYCLQNKLKSAERFAVRFAAKEAVYKALCSVFGQPISFIKNAKNIEIINGSGAPTVKLHGQVNNLTQNLQIKISLTHAKNSGFAVAIIF